MRRTIEPFYGLLGQRIAQARTGKGVSQQKLGSLLEPPVTRAAIANIETGKQRVLAKTLVDIADALAVPVTQLLPAKATGERRLPSEALKRELRVKLALSREEFVQMLNAMSPHSIRKPKT